MVNKPAQAEETQTLVDEGRSQQQPEVTPANAPAVVQPIQPLAALADEVADAGHALQPPEVIPANSPAVLQPVQCQGQPLADEVADERARPAAARGHSGQRTSSATNPTSGGCRGH